MRPSLLYINTTQFGYNTDSYKHCQNLKKDFELTYICFDSKQKKIEESGINIIYVPWKGSYVSKGTTFTKSCLKLIKSEKIDYIFAVYFPLISFFKALSPNKNIILDIRTGSVSVSRKTRIVTNYLMRLDAFFFDKISIISSSLAIKLKLNMNKVFILPLGADILSSENKIFDTLRLFYIGTLDGRNIHQTIYGLKLFLEQSNYYNINVSFDVVGSGNSEYTNILHKAIKETGLQDQIVFHGRKPHSELKQYFDTCNVGVSYIPITEYFDCQPPTKTFEYINAGMACIATETQENKKIINSFNGVLCQDNPESFCRALKDICENFTVWNSDIIRKTQSHSTWYSISENLKEYILT
tara:strand:+ start:1204 stop:2268 length:1065 start_codon:yes stop_codon:yes gene_type:complete